jgi:hypothetical protein
MRFTLVYFFAFICTLVFTACQKEISFDVNNPANPNPGTGTTGTGAGNMKAKFGGTQWIANKAAAAARMNGLINITGFSTDRKTLTITLTDSGVHRYILSDITMNAAAYLDSNDANPFILATNQGTYPTTSGGEVNITAIDTAKKLISGTFFFKMFRDVDNKALNVTEGSFTNLSYSTTMAPSAATDTFRVKIDGASWTPHSVIGTFVPMMNQIAVVANDATATKTVGLNFPSNITPGTYTLDFFGFTYFGQYNPDNDPNHSKASMSGSLTILEHNTTTKRIRGNFNFRGEELLNSSNFALLSDGYFSVKYQ